MTVEGSSTADLLSNLTTALASVSSSLSNGEQQFIPPVDGISLLDVKNDLLLSYLQNLVFLIILRLRNEHDGGIEEKDIRSQTLKKLVELRVYLERGVRPLESRLKYQIDQVLRAADDAERLAVQNNKSNSRRKTKTINGEQGNTDSDSSQSQSSEFESEPEIKAATYRPNPSKLLRKAKVAANSTASDKNKSSSGTYKPPRINPTMMPEPATERSRQSIRKQKSRLLDEYIDDEMSSTPRAQPSIGSNMTIMNHGRDSMSIRDRMKEKERTDYEERNFTRLPAISKAERRKAKQQGQHDRRDIYGGEDWTGLGGFGDRVSRSVAGRSRAEASNVFERRDKRRRATEDGPRGDGIEIGDAFQKRRKVLQGRAERKGRKG